MTALIVAENANLSDTLTVSANAVSSVKYGDANAGLKTGEEFSVEQALNMMLIKSANDIAYALGEHVGGSVANFANMMNKERLSLAVLTLTLPMQAVLPMSITTRPPMTWLLYAVRCLITLSL